MADISKITLPSGNTYNLKDQGARDLIAELEGGSYFLGVTTTALTDECTTNPITVGGVSVTAKNGNIVVYDKKEFVFNGTKWFEFGDLSALGTLAYKDTVTLNKGTAKKVLGSGTTATASAPTVSISGGTTDKVLGSGATFETVVTPSKTNIKATASGAAVGADGTAQAITGLGTPTKVSFVKSVTAEKSNKLVTTTVPNVTSVGSASDWGFAMGSGSDAETLIISGGNGTAPTLGTAKTVATGSVAADGTGSPVVTDVEIGASAEAITGLGTPTKESVLTGVKMTAQPTVALSTGAAAGTGVVEVATGISSAATSVDDKDEVTAVTGVGTATASAPAITINKDEVDVAEHGNLSVSVS